MCGVLGVCLALSQAKRAGTGRCPAVAADQADFSWSENLRAGQVMESFFGSLKQGLTHHERFADRDEARCKMFDCIEVFYNRERLHRSVGYRSPEEFEKMFPD
jgi:putative transposase